MNEELALFKARLEQLRESLRAGDESARESVRPVELDQASVGRLSRMDAMQGQAMAIEAQRRREIQSRRIELALARIDSGDYGICSSCDEKIDPRRLDVDPTHLLCIDCAAAREKP